MLRLLVLLCCWSPALAAAAEVAYYPVPAGSRPHDVAPEPDGSIWYTSQPKGAVGRHAWS